MATGILQIGLHNTRSGAFYDEIQALIEKYLLGDHSLETINAVIRELIDDELMFYTEEDFSFSGLSKTRYKVISQDTLIKLKQDKKAIIVGISFKVSTMTVKDTAMEKDLEPIYKNFS